MVDHCQHVRKYLYRLIYTGYSKVPSFTCFRWLFWRTPSTLKLLNQVRPWCLTEYRMLILCRKPVLFLTVISFTDLSHQKDLLTVPWSFRSKRYVHVPVMSFNIVLYRVLHNMRFPTIWYVRHLLVACIFNMRGSIGEGGGSRPDGLKTVWTTLF